MTTACDIVAKLFETGYAATDIISTLFRVTKAQRAARALEAGLHRNRLHAHEISEGLNSQLQLLGCIGRLSKIAVDFDVVSSGKV